MVDTDVEPAWLRTGYRFFPYAAVENDHWWVIRVNHGFPEHDLATLFIDGIAAADITPSADDGRPLVASIGRLPMTNSQTAVEPPLMPSGLARDVVAAVAAFVDYGSEIDDPCAWCAHAPDPFTPAKGPSTADAKDPSTLGKYLPPIKPV